MVPKLAEVPLPMLANESEIPGCPRDIGWLDRLGRLRFDLAQRWRQRRPSDDDAQVRLVIDQALGLSLLVQFMRQERPSAIPVPSAQMAFANECTNRQMIQSFRQSMQSPILLAVLDAETFDDALAVPEDIQRSIFQLTLRTRLSLSSFGEFHQFCAFVHFDRRGFKPKLQCLFGVGDGFGFRVSGGSATGQFGKDRRPAVCFGV